ncbi:penicillin-insensitive murein endopeptidase [Halioxenophilus aromaticivorans]|uniref:Replication initiation protein n=1 Tax=Halioxenophilus aromaticivorans TaxID=1306992 RepID=A0AAV3U6F0_9ALTE
MLKSAIPLILLFSVTVLAEESTCYGTTASGRLIDGVALPESGDNFVGYSSLARTAGRTYVHSKVRDIVVAAYKSLNKNLPGVVFKYAETGFKNGGQFTPHKTHQNGLSVDFMVPVRNAAGESVHLPTNPMNKLGYDIEFDQDGRYQQFTIDYNALAAHIVALHKASKHSGYDVWRVIFDPHLQPNLMQTAHGNYLAEHIQFSERRSWVRHDEHYHVDFAIPCH